MISIIAAMSKNRVIGMEDKDGKGCLCWHLPEDLKRFRKFTTNKIVIMGRKTFESIGRPLPNRINVVVSKNMEVPETDLASGTKPSLLVVRDISTAISISTNFIEHFKMDPEIMIIGGGQIYQQTIGLADRMYLTILDSDYEGTSFFPEFSEEHWKEASVEIQEGGYSYITYDRFQIND